MMAGLSGPARSLFVFLILFQLFAIGEASPRILPIVKPLIYHVAVCDQNSRSVSVYPSYARWEEKRVYWRFTALGTRVQDNSWNSLSDVKIRRVGAHGWIALVAASGGKVGIINITGKKRETTQDDLMWQATPGGNPHAIERIPNNGMIVVAGSQPGELIFYAPSDPKDINDYKKLVQIKRISFPGAHGVLWDPNGGNGVERGYLWALGDKCLRKFSVSGRGTKTVVREEGKPFMLPGKDLGHDLQPDYSNPDVLLLTDSDGAYEFNTKTNQWKELAKMRKLKSLVRTQRGEYIWVVGDKNELGTHVEFGYEVGKARHREGWKDAKFYKARVYLPAYESPSEDRLSIS
jgi:hypothetical protein